MAELLAQGDAVGGGRAPAVPESTWSSSASIPTGHCTWATAATPRTATRCSGSLAFSGANVATEFYINDYGRQMDRFGRSVAARYAQSFGVDLPVPADGYQGDYVNEIAAAVRAEVGDRYVEALKLAAHRRRGQRRAR